MIVTLIVKGTCTQVSVVFLSLSNLIMQLYMHIFLELIFIIVSMVLLLSQDKTSQKHEIEIHAKKDLHVYYVFTAL